MNGNDKLAAGVVAGLLGAAGVVAIAGGGQLSIAPPRKGSRIQRETFNPWDATSNKRKLAREFLDFRTSAARQLRDRIPELPEHIEQFAEYMREQSAKPLTARDLAKAYLITVSSIQRGERQFRGRATRPEDAMAEILQGPTGQRLLDSIEAGKVDRRAAESIARSFRKFGQAPTLKRQMIGSVDLASKVREADRILKRGSRRDWYRFVVDEVPGVSFGKSGFLAAMLGRGDMATADARQVNFWTCPPREWDRGRIRCKRPASQIWDNPTELVDVGYLELLNDRMRRFKMQIPRKYEGFREHLTHHAFWDTIGGTKTSHAELVDAMRLAGLDS